MKILKHKKKDYTVSLQIEESHDELRTQMDKVYPKVSRNVRISGFRKGKVPRHIFEKYYGEEPLIQEAVINVVNNAYKAALDELELDVVDMPKDVNVEEYKPDAPVVFSCNVDVKPDVKLGKYKGVKVKKESEEATDEDIKDAINRFLEQHATFGPIDRDCKDGDIVRFKIESKIDGEDYALWTRDNAGTSIGKGPFGEDFDKAITGLKKDDTKTFSVSYDDKFSNPDVQNKTVEFSVTITEVQEKQKPELTDELVEKLTDFKTVDEYKADIAKTIGEHKKDHSENAFRTALFEGITKDVKVEIPEGMIATETQNKLNYFDYTLKQQGSNIETFTKLSGKSLDELKAEIRPEAEKQVILNLTLDAIGKKEKLEVTDEDLNAHIEKWNLPDVKTIDDVREKHKEMDLTHLEATVLEQKTIDFLLSQAKPVK